MSETIRIIDDPPSQPYIITSATPPHVEEAFAGTPQKGNFLNGRYLEKLSLAHWFSGGRQAVFSQRFRPQQKYAQKSITNVPLP